MGITNTSYGTWCNQVDTYSTSPDNDVLAVINGGSSDWRELLESSGALAQIKRDYRAAIDAVLPADISLCGDEFIGPWQPGAGEFDGYPVNEHGALDFAAMVEDIDLEAIIARHDPEA
ncbi:hypothetical protein ABZV65_30430 [Streptomyces bauhiniae]|uniref:hypothetical protein n=1 Tax=Streptomyces bauhiniae TaxID=2340725 RepID=UPI0033B1604F